MMENEGTHHESGTPKGSIKKNQSHLADQDDNDGGDENVIEEDDQ